MAQIFIKGKVERAELGTIDCEGCGCSFAYTSDDLKDEPEDHAVAVYCPTRKCRRRHVIRIYGDY